LIKHDHLKKFTPVFAMESLKLDKDDNIDFNTLNSKSIRSFELRGNDQIVKSPVVMRIKPINHSNIKMISLELEGPEPFPNSNNICVIGEPLHVAYI
jgi:hypothetical protein